MHHTNRRQFIGGGTLGIGSVAIGALGTTAANGTLWAKTHWVANGLRIRLLSKSLLESFL